MIQTTPLLLSAAALASLCLPLAAQDTGRAIPESLQGLIPNDASALILISPLDDIEAAAQDLLEIAMPEMAMMADLDMLFAQLETLGDGPGMDLSLVDRTLPIGIALGPLDLVGGTVPMIYVMLPCTDPQAVLDAMPSPAPVGATRVLGNYLGACKDTYPLTTGDSKIASLLPEGLIAAALDARPLAEAFGPMAGFLAAMGVGQAKGQIIADGSLPPALTEMLTEILDATPATVADVIDSLAGIQISLDLNGSVLDINSDLLLTEGSLLSTWAESEGATFGQLAHLIDLDAPVSFGYGADLGGLARWVRPYVDKLLGTVEIPDELEDGSIGEMGPFHSARHALAVVHEATDSSLAALSNFGSGMVSSVNVVDGQPTSSFWLHGVNGDTLATNLSLMFESELAGIVGLQMKTSKLGEATTEIALSLNADTLAANFDLGANEASQIRAGFAEAFGESIKLTLTSVGGDTLLLYNGSKDALKSALTAAASAQRGTAPDVARLNGVLGDASPFSFLRMDLGTVAQIAVPIIEEYEGPSGMPEGMLDGISIPLTVHRGMTSERWMGGMSIDLKDALRLAVIFVMPSHTQGGGPPRAQGLKMEIDPNEEPVLRDAE